MPYRLGSILIILLAMFLRAHRASELGTQNDEGLHIVVAERVADGDVLYQDLYENRTPGVELLLAAAFSLVRPSVLLGRFLTLGIVATTIAALILSGRLSQKLVRAGEVEQVPLEKVAGWTAGLLFGLAPLAVFWSRFTMLEHWQTAAATVAIAAGLLAVTRGSPWFWLASGVSAGLAILAKQSGIVVAGTLLLYLLMMHFQKAKSYSGKALAYWLMGLVIPVVIFILWLSFQGALNDFFHMLSGADRLAPLNGVAEKGNELVNWVIRRPMFILGALGGLAVVASHRTAASLPLLWAIAETAALFGPPELDLGWGGFSHYVLPSLAALSVVGGLGVVQLTSWTKGNLLHKALAAGLLALILVTLTGWLDDLNQATTRSDYPQAGFTEEQKIGQTMAELVGEADPILVLANPSLYHWAERRPGNRFFHLPEYLPTSHLWPEAEVDILEALNGHDVGSVLVSRLHFEERLSDTLRESLQDKWLPAAIFSYPYQRDAILYLPRPSPPKEEDPPLSVYDAGISLLAVELRYVGDLGLMAGLWWTATDTPDKDWTVFVHVIDSAGRIVGQHDGVPGVGYRPTSSWAHGEPVADWHWIELPSDWLEEGAQLAIGLYDPGTGERSQILGGSDEVDSYLITVDEKVP